MWKMFLVLAVSFLVTYLSDYFSWGRFASESHTRLFGPPINLQKGTSTKDIINEVNRRGFVSEVTRSAIFALISLSSIYFFRKDNLFDIAINDLVVRTIIVTIFIYGIIHYTYINPKKLYVHSSKKYKLLSKKGFKEYFVPNLFSLFGFYAAFIGIFGTMVISMFSGINADLLEVGKRIEMINNINIKDIADLNYGIVLLISLGKWISQESQKYTIIGLISLIYVLLEQRSNMRYTIHLETLDKIKIFVWAIFIAALLFGMFYVPINFQYVHDGLDMNVIPLSNTYRQMDKATQMSQMQLLIQAQENLSEHNIDWLLLNIFTGYGNLAAIFLLVSSYLIRQVFFKDFPLSRVIELLLPSFLANRLRNIFIGLGVEEKDIPRT